MKHGMIELDPQDQEHGLLARVILAKNDMQYALAASMHVIDHVVKEEDPMFQPLMCAAVVCYARPFTKAEGYVQLPVKYKRFQDDDLKEMHDLVITCRHTCIAHSDAQLCKVSLIPKGSRIAFGGSTMTWVRHGEWVQMGGLHLHDFPSVRDLCTYQIQRLTEDAEFEKERLFP